jgi:FlaA1/EpsC-like NDP-sugar epimerase
VLILYTIKKICITGATGNIGTEVINSLNKIVSNQIIEVVSDLQKAKSILSHIQNIEYRDIDFETRSTFDKAPNYIDCLSLLRPP